MPRSSHRGEAAGALAQLPGAQPEPPDRVPPDDFRLTEDGNPAGATDLSGLARYRVEFVLYTTRPQDSDNHFIKPFVDQLRYHNLIPNDEPYSVKASARQVRVLHRCEEGTKIIIRKLKPNQTQ
jgi:hypothetical protein